MICSACQRDASENPAAYYNVGVPGAVIWMCWRCLSTEEKLALDPIMPNARKFKMEKTIKEINE